MTGLKLARARLQARRGLLLAGLALALLASCIGGRAVAQALDAPCASTANNVEYKDCLHNLAKEADRKLDALVKAALAKIERADFPDPPQRKAWRSALSAAQRDWKTFRDKDCGVMLYEFWGGSGVGGFISLCRLKHTRDRIKYLSERYELTAGAAPASYPFFGRWATQPEGQTASLDEICAKQSFGHLEIAPGKVREYESDCDVKSIEAEDGTYQVQSACFAEGEEYSELKTIEMRKDGTMRVVGRIPKWGKKTDRIYRRCS